MNNEQKVQNLHVSQHSSNTIVSRSQFKPILFSMDMVKAILSGRKKQTRRIIKQANGWDINWNVVPIKEEHLDGIPRYEIRCGTQYHLPWFKAKFNVGDILWVRETWRGIEQDFGKPRYEYKATEKINLADKWKPSLFMPKDACRLFLEVTDLRAERLHQITKEDAIAEGINPEVTGDDLYENYDNVGYRWIKAKESYKSLWQNINGNWNDNPFVWVITFELVECPKGFC